MKICIDTIIEENFVNVRLSSKADFPHVRLCNEDQCKNYQISTSLFIGEAINLYLNLRFNIIETDISKLRSTKDVFENDSFF